MGYIHRHMEDTIARFRSEFPAILLTGARQTGKTTLLKNITAKEHIKSISFDDPSEEMSAKSDPRTFLMLHPAPYMYDEVQYVPDLFRYIKMAIDQDRHPGMFFLTGSQQFKLHEEAAESLAGRVGILSLYGLSAREVRKDSFHQPFLPTMEYIANRHSANIEAADVWETIYLGSYPEVALGHVSRNDFYENYIKTYVERDIRLLTQVADELMFIQFIRTVAARTGALLNYADIAKDIGISEVTAKKWLSRGWCICCTHFPKTWKNGW